MWGQYIINTFCIYSSYTHHHILIQNIHFLCISIFKVYGRFLYYKCTLKNKGASGCHIRPFLSTWVHKEPLTSEESFCFTKGYLWWKKVLQIIKKQGRYGSLMNIWLVHWGTKNCYYMASLWITFELLLFLNVVTFIFFYWESYKQILVHIHAWCPKIAQFNRLLKMF